MGKAWGAGPERKEKAEGGTAAGGWVTSVIGSSTPVDTV